ncbi:MAG: hypothetical protein AB8G18_04645 [Gammaproteobacteria bacterium]
MPTPGPRISVSITSHGYGHLTQTMAVLSALRKRQKDVQFRIQCTQNLERAARSMVDFKFTHCESSPDVGLIQPDPINVDLPATYAEYSRFHNQFERSVKTESEELKKWSADMVISDISYRSLAAAANASITSIAIASLSWDHIVKRYFDLTQTEPAIWYQQMCEAYAQTTLALLPEPALAPYHFEHSRHIPPLLLKGHAICDFRPALGIQPDDERPIVFCSLGGIPASQLPLSAMEKEDAYHWLINFDQGRSANNMHFLHEINNWPYRDIMASVNAVVGKPGYCTAVEAAAYELPFVFTQRGHFPDEQPITNWLKDNARAVELTNEEWFAGRFADALREAFNLDKKEAPVCNGAEVAAALIQQHLE